MLFPYIKVARFYNHQKIERLLPWIRFGIYNPKDKNNILFPVGLIDSGSEITFVDHEFGKELGYDIKKGGSSHVVGVGGAKLQVFFHKVGITINDGDRKKSFVIEDNIAFTYNEFPPSMPQQTAILGTVGFFRHFNIMFNYPNFIRIDKKLTSN